MEFEKRIDDLCSQGKDILQVLIRYRKDGCSWSELKDISHKLGNYFVKVPSKRKNKESKQEIFLRNHDIVEVDMTSHKMGYSFITFLENFADEVKEA